MLLHAALAHRTEASRELAGPWRLGLTSPFNAAELLSYGQEVPDWVEIVSLDAIDQLSRLATWQSRLGSSLHHRGEAGVFTVAQSFPGAVCIVDDAAARAVARRYAITVHGTGWAVACAVREGRWDLTSATSFCDRLMETGFRWGIERGGFPEWAYQNHLLRRGEGTS